MTIYMLYTCPHVVATNGCVRFITLPLLSVIFTTPNQNEPTIKTKKAMERAKNGETGDRNPDLPHSRICKADALPLSHFPSEY